MNTMLSQIFLSVTRQLYVQFARETNLLTGQSKYFKRSHRAGDLVESVEITENDIPADVRWFPEL